MRRKALILTAAVLLALLLAVPASASKSQEVKGVFVGGGPGDFVEENVGNTCHVLGWNAPSWLSGDITVESFNDYRSVAQGPCPGGPFIIPESIHAWGRSEGEVLGKSGAYDFQCHGLWQPDVPRTLMYNCVIAGTEGELAGLKGHYTIDMLAGTYAGEVHFDPDK